MSKNGWIATKDKKPDAFREVLLWDGHEVRFGQSYSTNDTMETNSWYYVYETDEDGHYFYTALLDSLDRFTHWMYKPKPPKE